MASTYETIATYTVPSNVSSYTFTSIPQSYTDLVLISAARTTRGTSQDTLVTSINSDTTTGNYSNIFVNGNGSTASSSRLGPSSPYLGVIADSTASNSPALEFSSGITHFMNYANSTTYKSWASRSNIASFAAATVGTWRNTNAITSIKIQGILANDLVTGSTFTLYGIKAA